MNFIILNKLSFAVTIGLQGTNVCSQIYEYASVATLDIQSILEIPVTDEIHMEDRNHGLD